MRRVLPLAAITLIVLFCSQQAFAADERFAIRFGLILLEPTGSSIVQGERSELKSSVGGEFDFEWYFFKHFGLEGSVATAVDADVEENSDTVAGVTVTPITVGINWHVIRNERIDWYIGAVAGSIGYNDFTFTSAGGSSTGSVDTERDSTYGLQTALDIGVAGSGRWGINVGIKYLSAGLPIEGTNQEIAVDPFIARVMGVFRW
jgi:outer membrane protein W